MTREAEKALSASARYPNLRGERAAEYFNQVYRDPQKNMALSEIDSKDAIYDSIKMFLGKGK